MRYIADLHLHSRYSTATSRDLSPESLFHWARIKGLAVVGSADFTHPKWREELRLKLEPAEEGLYRLKDEYRAAAEGAGPCPGLPGEPRFAISGEISTIYKWDGRTRKVHHVILLPSLEAAERLSHKLEDMGANLHSDGRPILGLDSRNLLEITLEACPDALFIPAHIWTPHFSVLGAASGFSSIAECYRDLTPHIAAVETGLSSDPPMNWRLSSLDPFTLVSNSDAHSAAHLAREANVFDTDLSFTAMRQALQSADRTRFWGTLEFFPEEGKYHYDGHRACHVCWHPAQTRAAQGLCPVCGRPVTVGVLHRVDELADRPEGAHPAAARPFLRLVPLPEILAAALGQGAATRKVQERYLALIRTGGPELQLLCDVPLEDLKRLAGPLVAEAVRRVRAGEADIRPGYDGEYGVVEVLSTGERQKLQGQDALWQSGPEERPAQHPTREGQGSPGAQKKPSSGRVAAAQASSPQTSSWQASPGQTRGHEPPDEAAASEEGPGTTEPPGPALNPSQQAAVTAEGGPIVVQAGPGTGKTQTLAHRVAYLVARRGVPADHITAVTFTNRAAAEMQERVATLLRHYGKTAGASPGPGEKTEAGPAAGPPRDPAGAATPPQIHTGTFHSLCLAMLPDLIREWASAPAPAEGAAPGPGENRTPADLFIPLPGEPLRVLDDDSSRMVLAEAWQDLQQDGQADAGGAFRSGPSRRLGRHRLEEAQRRISLLKGRGVLPSQAGAAGAEPELTALYRSYQAQLRRYRSLDYDDILLLTAWLLERRQPAAPWRDRLSHLLVDEFQDVNPIQYRLVQLWAGDGHNLFVIGDPNQAIYGFRGADHRLFGRLFKDYPTARLFRLDVNYRSTPQIVAAATAVAEVLAREGAEAGPAAALIPVRPSGPPLRHWTVANERAEGIAIVQEIIRSVGGLDMSLAQSSVHPQQGPGDTLAAAGGASFSDFAVLARTTRQCQEMETYFLHAGIPYRVVGPASLLDDVAVRRALAFARLVVDPEDDLQALQVLRMPQFRLSPAGLRGLRAWQARRNAAGCHPPAAATIPDAPCRQAAEPPPSLIACARELLGIPPQTEHPELPPRDRQRLQRLLQCLDHYRQEAGHLPPALLLKRWLGEMGLQSETLLRLAEGFRDLPTFVRALTLRRDGSQERKGRGAPGATDGKREDEGPETEEAVAILTLHAAKGLEFPVVFVAGADDGLLPLHMEDEKDAAERLDEERRLFYVGITRAQRELVLISAHTRTLRSQRVTCSPSPFLADLPAGVLREETPDAAASRRRKGPEGRQLALQF